MKKLLLLSALLIFACSSGGDSNDNNNSSQNSFLNVRYEVTTTGDPENPSENWGEITYTNVTGNENYFSTNELYWESEIQIEIIRDDFGNIDYSQSISYVLLDANIQGGNDTALTIAKIFINNELEAESIAEQGADAYAIHYFY